ncbi:type IIL restriction-modification enzyme MmeI [uncultured Hymenobacter sp.]|uniref:type IIL restriction-modification enzyme MmeI n=1 Tax=uncultured Hymenobacter sp. TaxID=170016 RepID=UPI0035C9A668
MTYPDFAARWLNSGGSEHANYGLFLQDLCDLLGVPRPEPKTDDPAHDAYVFERGVSFGDGAGKKSTGRIDLYKRGCFVLETKQGVTRLDKVSTPVNTASAEPRTSNLEPRTSNGVSWALLPGCCAAATLCAARPSGAR